MKNEIIYGQKPDMETANYIELTLKGENKLDVSIGYKGEPTVWHKGVRFGMSNNLKYDNPYLSEWLDKHNYKVNYLNTNYSNCNYHKIDKSKDCEVLITNY